MFNESVRSHDWTAFLAAFTPDTVMRRTGMPAVEFAGRDAVEQAP